MSINNKNIRGYMLLAVVTVAALTVLSATFVAHGRQAPAPMTPTTKDVSEARTMADQFSRLFETAAQKVSPSVVPIFAEQVVTASNPLGGPDELFQQFFGDEFFKRFFEMPSEGGQPKRTVRSLGSGVIVSPDGYILTNNHVVSGAEKLTVVMEDGKKFTANVVGTDPQTDVAVVKIDGKDLPAASLGNSDDVSVGQWVIAVGNPFQLLHSVTAGIISAKGRSSIGLADYEDFIQTDASINPGNSGGALADLDGNVIGINTAISSPSGGSAGVGFAIPIGMARRVMNALMNDGKVSRGYLALVPQDIDENMAKAMNLKDTEGALVGDVVKGGPADKAGVERGDVIVEYDGKKIENSTELRNDVAQSPPHTTVDLTLLRDGKTKHVKVKLAEKPASRNEAAEQAPAEPESYQKMGLELQNLTPGIARQLGYEHSQGVVVSNVEAGSAAEDAGLRRGDLIKEADHKNVATVDDFAAAISHTAHDGTVLLLVQRGDNTFFAAVQLT